MGGGGDVEIIGEGICGGGCSERGGGAGSAEISGKDGGLGERSGEGVHGGGGGGGGGGGKKEE